MGDRMRFVYRHFPLDSVHPHARHAAEAAEAAAAQGRFWEMHDLLYENQDDLDHAAMRRHATGLGLDLERFENDLAERRHASRVREDRLDGERAGVEGTPTFFVNGARYEGSLDLEGLLAAVEEAAGGVVVAQSEARVTVRSEAPPDPLDEICSERRGVNTKTLKKVVQLAVEIAREGREGRKIGTLFVVGDSEEVIRRSRPDPGPAGRAPGREEAPGRPRHARDHQGARPARRGFRDLGRERGYPGARYLDAVSDDLDIPLGLGSRHVAAASVSYQTDAVAVAVSESSVVRMFDDGELVSEIIPEIWLLGGYGPSGSGWNRARSDMTVRRLED